MKNKILCLLLAMVLVIGMLASCNNGSTDGNGDGVNPDSGNPDSNKPAEKDPNAKLDWDTTEILFEMNMNSNNEELSSGLKRYYAGEDGSTDEIDDLIKERNRAAYSTAKVSIKYSYVGENDANYVWGKNADAIYAKAASAGQNNPDMYCHFAYDMVNASIKGSFANLYSTSYDSNNNGTGENYFRFTKADYNPDITNFFDSEAGEGYFKAYMDSLSLSSGKAYCLASDYCTDLVRSFLVIPVNVKLLGEVNLETSDKIVDLDGNGKYDVSDFYDMVWNGGWNYEMLAAISNAIYQDKNQANNTQGGTTTLGDIIGFAAGTGSGLTGSAILYTTDLSFIDRGTLTYHATNDDLNAFAVALNTLFGEYKSNGICTVSTADAQNFGKSGGGADLLVIRDEFAKNNNILFGGTVTVGSLEYKDYQEMAQGFGIVPVPVYKDGIEYKTLVHNLARIIGISVVARDEFEMATAFLNEVSTKSSAILNEYYEVNLAAAVSNGAAGSDNVKMLTYIRNHVNDCFDKTYEDMIAFYKEGSNTATWHNYFMSKDYQVSTMGDIYGSYTADKGAVLEEIKTAWNRLP